MGLTIEERVGELRADYAEWQAAPCGATWREWSVACTDHMPAILDALAAKDREIERLREAVVMASHLSAFNNPNEVERAAQDALGER